MVRKLGSKRRGDGINITAQLKYRSKLVLSRLASTNMKPTTVI